MKSSKTLRITLKYFIFITKGERKRAMRRYYATHYSISFVLVTI